MRKVRVNDPSESTAERLTLNVPSPVIATRTPLGASATFGSSRTSMHVWLSLSARADLGAMSDSVKSRASSSCVAARPP